MCEVCASTVTNRFWYWNLELSPSRSHYCKNSISTEGIADIFMCHKFVSEEVLRKRELFENEWMGWEGERGHWKN